MDSVYPGRPDGSPTERIAHLLYSEFASKCDYVIDIHTATTGGRNIPHAYVPPHNAPNARLVDSFDLAKAFRPDLIIRTDTQVDYGFDLSHLSPFFAAKMGCRGIYVEMGEGNRLEESYVERGFNGLLDVLRRIKCLPRVTTDDKEIESRVVTRVSNLKSCDTGLLRLKVELGSSVSRGQVVAEICEPLGSVKTCLAPLDGFVFRVQTHGIAFPGDNIVSIGYNA